MTGETVTIKYIRDYDEYRVPGANGKESTAYYTNDKQDALGTARLTYGPETSFRFRSVNAE